MKTILLLLLGVGLAGLSCSSKSSSANLGMAAPPLKIAQWVKGQPVDLAAAKGSKVIVVEFWATWCPPCRASIPHLTELQKRFKDRGVVIVGISNEALDTVKPFVAQMADKMDYVVGLDDGNQTSNAYMGAFGVDGIPHAFVVDRAGTISWHGHPMVGLDRAVEMALANEGVAKAAK